MSPEQAELTSVDVDTRADIYSLGAMLYEMTTGYVPFEGTAVECTTVSNQANLTVHVNGTSSLENAQGGFALASHDDATPPNPIASPIAIREYPAKSANICIEYPNSMTSRSSEEKFRKYGYASQNVCWLRLSAIAVLKKYPVNKDDIAPVQSMSLKRFPAICG